jgi:type I restriction enzyme S subunit
MKRGSKLKDICDILAGQPAPQGDSCFSKNGTPFIRAGSLEALLKGMPESSMELINDTVAREYRLKLFPKNTILFAKSGMSAKIGRVYRLKNPAYVVSHLAAVVPGDQVDPSYLQRWFEYNPPSRLIPNDAYPSIRTTEIEKLRILLPPTSEQRRIAAILDKADTVRRKRQQTIQLLDQFLRSVFLDMFGDPVRNEKGWPIENLESTMSQPFQNGAYYEKKYYCHSDGTKMVHMKDAFYGMINEDNLKNVHCNAADVEKYGLTANDLLIARRSLNYEGAAKPCMIPVSKKPMIFESSLIRLRPNTNKILTQYLFHYLSDPNVRQYFILPYVTKSTISGINQNNLSKIKIIIPPISIQNEFLNKLNHVNTLSNSYKTSSIFSGNLFNTLVQDSFRGDCN